MTRLRQMKGFTLIELIVVVIIIGVLAAIAAVAYNQFVDNSRSTALTASSKSVDNLIKATSSQLDKAAGSLTSTGATPDLDFSKISGAAVTQGTTAKNKFLVVNGTRKACLVYDTVVGSAATVTVNNAAANADAC